MPMSQRLLRPRQTIHPEAAGWANRVRTNGGSVSGSTLSAVDKFCKSISQNGLRDRFLRLNLFCGTGLNAALVPLYRGPSLGGTQYGNTTDTNNGPFVSGDYSESTGLLGNGSSKYLNTGFDASAAGLSASGGAHLSIVVPTYSHPASGNWFPIAIINSGVTERFWINNNSYAGNTSVESYLGSTGANLVNYQVAATNGATIAGGLWTANRSSPTDLRLYNGTSQQGATQTGNVSASVMPTLPLTVFARWNGTTPFGYFGNGSVGRIMAYSAGLSMTSAQLTSFNNAMSAFNSALARNV